MSIITEALKKAQEQKPDRPLPPAGNSLKIGSEGPSSKDNKASAASHPYLVYVLLGAVLAVFIAALIIIVILFLPSSPSVKPAEPLKQAVPVTVTQKTNILPAFLSPPAAAKKDNAPAPELSGIMYTSTRPQAVINGQTVFEGETVDGFTVIRIYPDSVMLSSNGVETEVKLK